MTGRPRVYAALLAIMALVLTACASARKPQPVDPQITILQKQLLELQNAQNETRRKVDEQAGVAEALSTRVKAIEERPTVAQAAPPSPSQITSKSTSTSLSDPVKKQAKKPVKKKKKKPVRRQEP
jgi:hypothetical protein